MLKSLRLQGALAFVNPAYNYADIGADHGYLAAAILDLGSSFVQVVENKDGPLAHAKTNLQDYDNVGFTLADGLTQIDPKVNAVTICGMGGLNIVGIIDDELLLAKSFKQLILEPNSKIHELRTYLSNHHFVILGEKIVYEQGKYYEIIACRYDEDAPILTEAQIYFGPCLMKEKSILFRQKYLKIYQQLQKTLALLHEEHVEKRNEIMHEMALIEELELNYENN